MICVIVTGSLDVFGELVLGSFVHFIRFSRNGGSVELLIAHGFAQTSAGRWEEPRVEM